MSKRVAFIVAEGTELTECIATADVLLRAGIEVDYFGKEYTITHWTDYPYETFSPTWYDAIVFPGGGKGVDNVKGVLGLKSSGYFKNSEFIEKVLKMKELNKLFAAICAAPSILGELGFLKGKKYTCYPGFSSESFKGEYTGETLVVDKQLITARSMYYSVDFGLAIVEHLLGKAKRDEIESQVKGLKPKKK